MINYYFEFSIALDLVKFIENCSLINIKFSSIINSITIFLAIKYIVDNVAKQINIIVRVKNLFMDFECYIYIQSIAPKHRNIGNTSKS